jgi:hypothetical protein
MAFVKALAVASAFSVVENWRHIRYNKRKKEGEKCAFGRFMWRFPIYVICPASFVPGRSGKKDG